MKEKIKNLKKSTKLILVFLVALILVVSATGIALYTQEVNSRVLQTQAAYWGLNIPSDEQYSELEKAEFIRLLDSREFMFNNLYFSDLQNLQQDFDLLDQQVKNRIEIDKKYAEKKAQAEGIKVLEGANATETDIFNIRKNELFKLIEERQPFEAIEAAFSALQGTNTDIQKRIDQDVANAARQSSSGSSSGGGDYYPSRQSTGGSSGGDNRGNGNRPSRPSDSNGEKCEVLPNGSTWCWGGDW